MYNKILQNIDIDKNLAYWTPPVPQWIELIFEAAQSYIWHQEGIPLLDIVLLICWQLFPPEPQTLIAEKFDMAYNSLFLLFTLVAVVASQGTHPQSNKLQKLKDAQGRLGAGETGETGDTQIRSKRIKSVNS